MKHSPSLFRTSKVELVLFLPPKKCKESNSELNEKRTGRCSALTSAVSPAALTVAIATAISVAFRGSNGCADCDLKIGICDPADINYM